VLLTVKRSARSLEAGIFKIDFEIYPAYARD
jgi:hypothetical protein